MQAEILLTLKLQQKLFADPRRISLLKHIALSGSISQGAKDAQFNRFYREDMKYRLIKIKNEWLMKGEKMKAIAMFNNKGGVGKTTLTCNLSAYIARTGKKVMLIDADPQCNSTIYCFTDEKCIMTKRDLQFMT